MKSETYFLFLNIYFIFNLCVSELNWSVGVELREWLEAEREKKGDSFFMGI